MKNQIESLTSLLGHEFRDPALLELALTHKSFRNEQPLLAPQGDNERMEFLGDAVLDLALSDLLMVRFPNDPEGPLSKKRASLVNEAQLSEVAREAGVLECIRLGKGERQSGGGSKPRILASTLEAIFGAIFRDAGYEAARVCAERLFAARIEAFPGNGGDFAGDFKTRLQELAQDKFKVTPTYYVEREEGPDHEKTFEISVRLESRVLATGSGRNKKIAEQEAARRALDEMTEKLS